MTRPSPYEACVECGFDASMWNDQDTITTIQTLEPLVSGALAGVDAQLMSTRPSENVWSMAEYVDHIREVTWGNLFLIGLVLDPDHTDELTSPDPAAPGSEVAAVDVAEQLDALGATARELSAILGGLEPEEWKAEVVLDGVAHNVAWSARHVVHDAFHHLLDIARIRAVLGDGVARQEGSVHQVSASGGGVPKLAVSSAMVDRSGVVDDAQDDRRHHGRPFQALCLYSLEIIEALAGEGHPIVPGAAGENLTLTGIDWQRLRPGLDLTIGDVRARLTAPAVPCGKNNRWFASGTSSKRIDHDQHPGWSRWYAEVLSPGTVVPGAPVVVTSP